MTCCCTFQMQFHEASTFSVGFFDGGAFGAEFGQVYEVAKDFDPYTGVYVVIPKTFDQTLLTKRKVMTDNVLVKEIPYAETANTYGTTVTIAS